MKPKLTFFFVMFLLIAISQDVSAQVNLDSLWAVWEDSSQPDSSRIKALQTIAWDGYLYTQPDSTYYFAQLMYDFAKEKGIKKKS